MGKSAEDGLIGMVVDANGNMQSIIAGMLKSITRQGKRLVKEVKRAASIESAWNLTDGEEEIGFVICDVDMGEYLKGVDFLKRCSRDPLRRYLPFIMMSGNITPDTASPLAGSIREWGAECLILKPFAQVVLEEKVRYILDRFGSPEETVYRKLHGSPPEKALATIGMMEEKGFTSPKLDNIAGEKYMEKGEKEKAAERFERAVAESETAFLAALRNHAEAQEELGNTGKALEAIEKLDILSPYDFERKVKFSRLLVETGQEEKGREVLMQAVTLARKCGKEEAIRQKVDAILSFIESDEYYKSIIKQNMHDLKKCNEIALGLRKDGKYDKAEKCYDFILSHHPNHPVVLYNKAVLFMAQQRYGDALPVLKAVLARSPQFPKAGEALISCMEKMGTPVPHAQNPAGDHTGLRT